MTFAQYMTTVIVLHTGCITRSVVWTSHVEDQVLGRIFQMLFRQGLIL